MTLPLPLPVLLWSLAVLAALLVVVFTVVRRTSRARPGPLPTQWNLKPRPVFSTAERRVHRLLCEAFPQLVVLSKLPLVRFCQSEDPDEAAYWFDLLGAHHVTFAVCSANGRVLVAIDLDLDQARRGQQIKQAVLDACRVRYLRCTPESLPSPAELQLLVPAGAAMPRDEVGATLSPDDLQSAREALASAVATRRAARPAATARELPAFQDSFFAPDSRQDTALVSGFGALRGHNVGRSLRPDSLAGVTLVETVDEDIGGIVEADTPARQPEQSARL